MKFAQRMGIIVLATVAIGATLQAHAEETAPFVFVKEYVRELYENENARAFAEQEFLKRLTRALAARPQHGEFGVWQRWNAVLPLLVQPAASSHPLAACSHANLPRIDCTRIDKLLVRLIRGKSYRRLPHRG